MKKILDIAFKDMKQYFRSLIALVMMFGVPILLVGMFYIMFGNEDDEQGFVIPVTNVVIVNQDEGVSQVDEGFPGMGHTTKLRNLIILMLYDHIII